MKQVKASQAQVRCSTFNAGKRETCLLVIPFADVCKGHVVQVLVSKQSDSQPKGLKLLTGLATCT